MNYASIYKCDTANGTGFRVSLFVSGCGRKCKGCHNAEAQNPDFGKPFDATAKGKIFDELAKPYCKGLSILGGEPMSVLSDNRSCVLGLVKEVKSTFKDKDIWLWSGYTLEELEADATTKECLSYVDVLVDGPFIEELKDSSLAFRGSSNQRIILNPGGR
ncbi:MAG: anaerobic ribonucleoside-triphosphate reductase activating protein [Bacteroidales bacterium]|nr:anaerobic ribonucleoside-triphosphate reductase activating protein [Bacteroidales bacterium]